jgi:hypothetical protein
MIISPNKGQFEALKGNLDFSGTSRVCSCPKVCTKPGSCKCGLPRVCVCKACRLSDEKLATRVR